MNYQYMKKYQEKTERDIHILLKEHKSVVDQVIAKVQVKEDKWAKVIQLSDILRDVCLTAFLYPQIY